MASIADVFLKLALDAKSLELDAKRTGDQAGKTLGERLKAGISAQRVGTALGAAVGGAIGGALAMADQYDAAMDGIRAGTGATGDALAGLEDSFRGAAGRVKEDISITSAVLADLHSRTGLTGEALEDLTVKVIEFSRVTKTDAVANVALVTRVFGDWSVATEDQAGTMDKLLRASQATGLGVDALMQTVVQFGAPLRLLGFGLEESVALLSKWEKEGVNTETMLQGLKFSVKTLAQEGVPASEMAETLRGRIEAIGESADPVADAIELFGLRAGPDLAAAILEGRFEVEDLLAVIETGSETVDTAAEDIRDFGDGFAELKNKVKLAIGPILADFAGLAEELGNAIYLLPVLGGAIGRGLGAAWKKGASSSIVKAAVATAGSLAATLYIRALYLAGAISGAVSAAWGRTAASRAVAGAVAKAGALAATAYLKVLIIGDALSGALAGVWTRIAGTGSKATMAAGAAGRAAGLAFKLGMLAVILSVADMVEAELNKAAASLNKTIWGDIDWNLNPEEWPWPLGPKGAPDWAGGSVDTGVDKAAALPGKIADDLVSGWPKVQAAATGMAYFVPNALGSAKDDAVRIAASIPQALAGGLRDKRTAWQQAWDQLKEDAKNSMTTMQEIAKIRGKLIKIAVSEGWTSGDPVWVQSLKDTQAILEARLAELEPMAEKKGDKAGGGLADGLDRKKGAVRNAAGQLVEAADDKFDRLPGMARSAGQRTAEQLALGLASRARAVAIATSNIAHIVQRGFQIKSPAKAGPWSKDGGPIAWMARAADDMTGALVGHLVGGIPAVRSAVSAVAGAVSLMGAGSPSLAFGAPGTTGIPSMGLAGAVAGGITIGDIHVDARGAKDPQAVGHAVRQAVMDATAEGLQQQTARLPVGTRA